MEEISLFLEEKNYETETTFADIYDINYSDTQVSYEAIESNIEEDLGQLQQKNDRQIMESKAILFSEQEKIFRERTGKDFSTLYTKYYPKLVYFTSKITNDPQKAEDISTDSFMAAFEKIEKYEKEKSQFSTWLFTIAKNLALQDLKNDKKTMSLDIEFDDEGTTMKDFIQEEDNDNHIHELHAKKAEIMRNHIAKLKNPYRDVIEMRELKKMSYKDISDKLNLNLSTVKSQIRNGRAILIRETKREFDALDEMLM